jgi:putative tryptophan/tyrosine transport system substrate-binding protein
MRRREFISLLGGAAVSWPVGARAQQQPQPVIGFVNAGFPEAARDELQGFLKGLGEIGLR